jgi:hypothetical protein
MTIDEAIDKARARIGQIVRDHRRSFATDAILAGADVDDVDQRIEADDEEFSVWLEAVLSDLRTELAKVSRERW